MKKKNSKRAEQPAFYELLPDLKKSVFVIHVQGQSDQGGKLGTGFFIKEGNVAVTNYHVVDGVKSAMIKTSDGDVYPIESILRYNKEIDFAVIKIRSEKRFTPLKLSSDRSLQGEDVFTIGNPSGFEFTVSNGIVSALRSMENNVEVIQITAPISPGSSGGPVMNKKGEVIGIATFKIKECENCNFAIAISQIN